jgi:hypothetical protein
VCVCVWQATGKQSNVGILLEKAHANNRVEYEVLRVETRRSPKAREAIFGACHTRTVHRIVLVHLIHKSQEKSTLVLGLNLVYNLLDLRLALYAQSARPLSITEGGFGALHKLNARVSASLEVRSCNVVSQRFYI